MKRSGWILAAMLLGDLSPALAFHDGGVASCSGCHVMHDGPGGPGVAAGPEGPGLLIAESPSDVCLGCHADDHGRVLGSDLLNPPPEKGGGNFVFLREDNINDASDGATQIIPGDAAGHNLLAPGHGLASDPRYATSPGGTFRADELGCTSCHDPHGNGNFRHLYGDGPVQGGAAFFSYPAPEAAGIDLDAGFESPSNHTAYRRGMSDWCGNCHGRYHEDSGVLPPGGGEPFEHGSDETLGGEIRDRYNIYNGDADPTGGTFATAYLAEVPFEDSSSDPASRSGAGSGSRVMCLTCHRAHATSSPAAGRWDLRVDRLGADGVASGSFPIPNPYVSPDQGPLCAKCHEGGSPAAR